MTSLPLILPSHDYLETIRDSVLTRVPAEMATAGTEVPFLDALGELGLGLAHRPESHWVGSSSDLCTIMAGVRSREASTTLEIGLQAGLLAQTPAGLLYPKNIQQMHWLAARRTWMTEDDKEYMIYRMRGSLWEVFAMAAASHPDDELAAGLVDVMARDADIWDDQLHLAQLLAAETVAWGAEAEPELRVQLVQRALFEWSIPEAPPTCFDTAAALLGAEIEYGEMGEEVLAAMNQRLDEIVELLDEHPDAPILAQVLETHLCAVVRAVEDIEELGELIERVGERGASVAHALARSWPPSEGRDDALVYIASRGVQRGDLSGMSAIAAVTEHADPGALNLAMAGLQMLIDDNQDEDARRAADAVCNAVACWEVSEDSLAHQLAQLVIAGVAPPARLAAAFTLSQHEGAVAAYRATLLETLELNFHDPDEAQRAAIIGAALQLHTDHEAAAAVATALVADGVPVEVIAPFIDEGLRGSPAQGRGLEVMWSEASDAGEEMTMASMMVLDHVAEQEMTRLKMGPYSPASALPVETRRRIIDYLTTLADDLSQPLRAGQANLTLGWFVNGDSAHGARVLAQYAEVEGTDAEGIYVLAMGAAGVRSEAIIDTLGRLAAKGDSEMSSTAGASLSMLLTVWHEADPLAPYIDEIVARAAGDGEEASTLFTLLHSIARLPTGGT